jgi:transcriptional activator cubitus interruptus
MVLRAMIDFDQNSGLGNGGGGVSLMAPIENTQRNRFRSRLQNKGGLVQPPSPSIDYLNASSPRSVYGIGELNRRITDLKVDNPALSPPQNFPTETSPKLLELGQNYPSCQYQTSTMIQQYNQHLNPQMRRDSNNSTTSSSYYSMKSCDISRRSSQQSYTSSMNTIRHNNYVNYDPQFYDPISAGSSRRSSQMSNTNDMNYGPPSSQLLSSHLARLQRQSAMPSGSSHPYHSNYYQQSQYYGYGGSNQHFGSVSNHYNFNNFNQQILPHMGNMNQLPTSSTDRRMSEPISNSSKNVESNANHQAITRRPRSTTPTKSLEMLLDGSSTKEKKENYNENNESKSPMKPHPNETVVLDVLKTNEKIENCDELVIPDEMVMYLNQVGDDTAEISNESKIKLDIDGEPLLEPSMSSSISIEKIKEEDLFSLLAEVDVKPDEEIQSAVNELEINNNSDCKTETDIKSNAGTQQILCKS